MTGNPPSLKLRRTKGELAHPDSYREARAPIKRSLIFGELAQLARAPALHAGGQGFDSLILHKWIAEGGLWISDLRSEITDPQSEIIQRFFDMLE